MQPYHSSDRALGGEAIGPERINTSMRFDRCGSGARLALAAMVSRRPTPLEALRGCDAAPLGRQEPGGGCGKEDPVYEALKAYTAGGAYAAFRERDTGTIAPGMLADLTVIDRDLRVIPAAEIRDARIVRTIAGGKTVFPF